MQWLSAWKLWKEQQLFALRELWMVKWRGVKYHSTKNYPNWGYFSVFQLLLKTNKQKKQSSKTFAKENNSGKHLNEHLGWAITSSSVWGFLEWLLPSCSSASLANLVAGAHLEPHLASLVSRDISTLGSSPHCETEFLCCCVLWCEGAWVSEMSGSSKLAL